MRRQQAVGAGGYPLLIILLDAEKAMAFNFPYHCIYFFPKWFCWDRPWILRFLSPLLHVGFTFLAQCRMVRCHLTYQARLLCWTSPVMMWHGRVLLIDPSWNSWIVDLKDFASEWLFCTFALWHVTAFAIFVLALGRLSVAGQWISYSLDLEPKIGQGSSRCSSSLQVEIVEEATNKSVVFIIWRAIAFPMPIQCIDDLQIPVVRLYELLLTGFSTGFPFFIWPQWICRLYNQWRVMCPVYWFWLVICCFTCPVDFLHLNL